jgi:hypothetical protein
MSIATLHRLLPFALLALLALACAKEAETRSLVPVDLEGPADADLDEVEVRVGHGDAVIASRTLAWKVGRGETMQVGIYLPASEKGSVDVTATAHDGKNHQFVGAPARTSVASGQVAALVTLVLRASAASSPDGGASDRMEGGAGGDAKPEDMATADAKPADTAGDTSPSPDAPPAGRRWGPLANVENDALAHSGPAAVAIHPSQGHVLVAWPEEAAIKLLRYDGGTATWGSPKLLDTHGSIGYTSLQVVFAANGHAMVLWSLDPNTPGQRGVWASRSTDAGVTWSMPVRLHDGPARYSVEAGISQTGVVRVLWEEAAALNDYTTAWSAVFNPGTGTWTNVAAVAPPRNVTGELSSRLAMDASGAGVLVFIDAASAADITSNLWATAFTGTDTLAAPKLLASHTGSFGLYQPEVAVAPGGKRAVVLADEAAGGNEEMWMYELDNGAWKPRVRLVSAGYARRPSLVIDTAGVTTAAWSQPVSGSGTNVLSARHVPGQGWSAPTPLETSDQADGNYAPEPQLGVDGAGNVHATWRRFADAQTGTAPAVLRSYTGGQWQPELVFDLKPGQLFVGPTLAVADNGLAAMATVLADPKGGDANGYNVFVTLFR